ncbi:MAG: hydrolase [Ruminococcaceae bacterium]|nr:hydrolase [Oscillospiraceae bacterium]
MEQALNTPPTPQANPSRSRVLIAILVLFLPLLLAYFGLCLCAEYRSTFYPNTTVNGTTVGSLTETQAQALLMDDLPRRPLTLADGETGEALLTVPLSALGYTAETFASLAQTALQQQRQTAFFLKGWGLLSALMGNAPAVQAWPPPNNDAFEAAAERLAERLSLPPIHGAYAPAQNGIAVTCPRDGRAITAAALDCLRDPALWQESFRADLSFSVIPAQTLTARDIAADLCGEAQNAGYDPTTNTITPERPGVSFDTEAAQQLMDAAPPGKTILLPADIRPPAVTAEQLRQLLFRDVLGECRTVVSGTAARKNNVRLAANAMDGTVLNAGETFSFNETVGQRTAARGYRAAPAYVQGETVDEIGGGICQTSSTLYLACLYANLQITERYAHRYTPSYIDWGMDATVSWGGPDYRFTNNTDYPVKISTAYENGQLTVRLLGTNLSGITVKMTGETVSKTPWKTVYQEDASLAPGTEQVKTSPHAGCTVKTYRTLYAADGQWLSTTYEATSSYKSRDRVVLRGPETEAPPAVGTEPLPADPPLPEVPSVPTAENVPLPAAPTEPAEPAETPPDAAAAPPEPTS